MSHHNHNEHYHPDLNHDLSPYWLNYFGHDDCPHILDEATYKEIMLKVTKNNLPAALVHDLPHRDYAPLIPQTQLIGIKSNTLKFHVPNRFNGWNVYIMYDDWDDQVKDSSITAVEAARLLLWAGNIRLHCSCPSELFYGYRYIQTTMDSAIIPEKRYPHIKNPNLVGICCKHERKCLKTLPFFLGKMAAAIKEQRRYL